MRKFTNKIFMGAATFIVAVSMIFGAMTTTYGLSDGAYVVKASGHYVHPKTGKVIDSGNNPGIGQGMVEGVVERTALVEKVGNKTYVTIGMGLMSNITKVRVYTERNGSYTGVSITKTGSFKKNGDYVYQYRFQMNDTGDIISPALYVEPMGREVKFFINCICLQLKKEPELTRVCSPAKMQVKQAIKEMQTQHLIQMEKVTAASLLTRTQIRLTGKRIVPRIKNPMRKKRTSKNPKMKIKTATQKKKKTLSQRKPAKKQRL